MAKIIRYCLNDESHLGDNAVSVARPSIFGNPYTHIKNRETLALIKVKNRDEAIDLYDKYFDVMCQEDESFKQAWDNLYEKYKNNDCLYLGCYCHLDERCHVDVIAKKLRSRGILEMIENHKKQKN